MDSRAENPTTMPAIARLHPRPAGTDAADTATAVDDEDGGWPVCWDVAAAVGGEPVAAEPGALVVVEGVVLLPAVADDFGRSKRPDSAAAVQEGAAAWTPSQSAKVAGMVAVAMLGHKARPQLDVMGGLAG
jgi:hypothetical protein